VTNKTMILPLRVIESKNFNFTDQSEWSVHDAAGRTIAQFLSKEAAYLLAAAPDLLAVCQGIAAAAHHSDSEEKFGEEASEHLEALHAAVAKTTPPQ
jgi:hypothetical protein